jgi:hypothetical protein
MLRDKENSKSSFYSIISNQFQGLLFWYFGNIILTNDDVTEVISTIANEEKISTS